MLLPPVDSAWAEAGPASAPPSVKTAMMIHEIRIPGSFAAPHQCSSMTGATYCIQNLPSGSLPLTVWAITNIPGTNKNDQSQKDAGQRVGAGADGPCPGPGARRQSARDRLAALRQRHGEHPLFAAGP